MTAEMTFDGIDTHHEKSMKYDIPMVRPNKGHEIDSDSGHSGDNGKVF